MERLVRLFRALANRERICILRLLAVLGERCVGEIARAAGRGGSRVSVDLGILAASGLVWRRRSGRTVGYRLAERPGSPVTVAAVMALARAFAAVPSDSPEVVARADQADSATHSDSALFACFTAFTHPRRLQILRSLALQGPSSLVELAVSLSMSPRACLRHLAKLAARGLVRRKTAGRTTRYALLPGHGGPQRLIARAVAEELGGMEK